GAGGGGGAWRGGRGRRARGGRLREGGEWGGNLGFPPPNTMTSFSLRQVKLRPGEQYRDGLEVELSPLDFGGQRYVPVPEQVPAAFEMTRATTGTVFTLAFTARLHGPCYRCLGDAVLEVPVEAREYQDESPEEEQMPTPYIEG